MRRSRATYSAAWFTSETVFWRRVVGTHVELFPGANDQDLHHIQRVLGPEYVLTLTSEIYQSETSEEDLEAFRETISHVLESGDGQDLNH